MLYTRNAFYFRKFYKEEVARERAHIDLNFVGSLHPEKSRNETGFSKLIYGNREDLGKLLGTIALNVAADDQAIYELIQNADDCKSSFFSVSYNENYLLCINNGSYFSDRDMSAIINVAGNYKDGEDIGTFGIGFKILHRLVGADDGREAIINDYAGPIIFSWNKYLQLKKFIEGEPILVSGLGKAKENYDYERDRENPWLVKILYTCFPSNYKEPIRLGDYETRDVRFEENELQEMREFLKGSLQNVNLTEDNYLKSGSIFFLKLGKGKSRFLDDGIDKIKSGLSYSFKFLNSLNKIYINGDEIKAQSVSDYSHSFPIDSIEFKDIRPKNKKRDIKFTFAFYRNYKMAIDLRNEVSPNLYTFFSMDEEKNGFSFLLHCNAFDMNNDRRKLQANSQINEKLLPLIAKSIIEYANVQKEGNRNLFLSLYANFLLSKDPKSKPHIDNNFSKFIHDYVLANIPTKNGFSDNPQNVKINKLKIEINLSDFGLSHIHWFEWSSDADNLLIEEARKPEKLGIKEWDIRDIVENANLENINNWIASCEKNKYELFLKELEESYLRKETKERICQLRLFKFSNGEFYSFNEVVSIKDRLSKTSFKVTNCFFTNNKIDHIKNELIKLGFIVSELSIENFPTILSSVTLPEDKKIYELIAEKCKTNTLKAEEKKKLFLNFINEATKFDNVAEGTLKDLQLFCDSNSTVKPLSKLIGNIKTPSWLNSYKIKQEEYFPELNSFLISEQEDIFKEVYQTNRENIRAELTTAEEIKSLIKLYQDNQKLFFKEFIIKKEGNAFSIDDKTSKTYQVQSADKATRQFIDKNCAGNLFVLPIEFVEKYKDEEGIIKADDLHSLILEFVDVDEHKEILVDIVKYKATQKLLHELSEFRFNTETEYTKETYEFKILDLACNVLKENDYKAFQDKVVIVVGEQDLTLSEIPPFADKIRIENYNLSLSKILPDNYQNSNHLSGLINQFIALGLNKERVDSIFGLSEVPDPKDIFQMFSEQVEILDNGEQLAFLFLYGLFIEEIDFSKFKALNVGEEEMALGTDKYLTDFDFIQQSEILHQKYRGVTKIFKDFPIIIEDNDHLLLLNEPYFADGKFVCPYIKADLSDEQKLILVEFLFNQWNKPNRKAIIKGIDWSKIDDVGTENILGFNPITSVYPIKYACEGEVLPDYLIKWIGQEESKISFLTDLGVWTENSVIVELRKVFKGEIIDFHSNRLAQEKRFNEDETVLFNSLVWLKENGIEIKTSEQFETLRKVVEVINENRTNNSKLKIQEEFDFEELEKNSTEWEESYYQAWKEEANFSIFLYEGELPKSISLDEIDDYVFFYFPEGNVAIDKSNIFINKNADVKKELRKLELEYDNFDFDGLWQNKLEVLEKENAQLRRTNEATLGTEFSSDISKNDQKEVNREAKEIVKEKLEKEGFEFTKGIGRYSTINGVFKDDVEYPLVVKSYKYQDEPLKIGANEWIQLMRPNSMFWVHFGNRKLGCLKLNELLRNQDKLTLRFSTENLDVERRLEKFAELLRYFSNVHFDFDSVKPSDYSVVKDLSDYRFDERRNEEDLSSDDDSLL